MGNMRSGGCINNNVEEQKVEVDSFSINKIDIIFVRRLLPLKETILIEITKLAFSLMIFN
jgi:hypothetical protein